jgi:hypothetical protein
MPALPDWCLPTSESTPVSREEKPASEELHEQKEIDPARSQDCY